MGKKLKAANMDEAREMAREYEELFEQYPNRRIYMGVHIYISVADLIRRETYEGIAAKNAGQFSEEDLRFQWDLVKSAHSGDLASQLELAKHLEAGDRFIQGNAKAYTGINVCCRMVEANLPNRLWTGCTPNYQSSI